MPTFVLVSEFDYYFVCKELGVKEPDQWASQVSYAQIVKWVVFYRNLHKQQSKGPGA
jgi:hypothetical protein